MTLSDSNNWIAPLSSERFTAGVVSAMQKKKNPWSYQQICNLFEKGVRSITLRSAGIGAAFRWWASQTVYSPGPGLDIEFFHNINLFFWFFIHSIFRYILVAEYLISSKAAFFVCCWLNCNVHHPHRVENCPSDIHPMPYPQSRWCGTYFSGKV